MADFCLLEMDTTSWTVCDEAFCVILSLTESYFRIFTLCCVSTLLPYCTYAAGAAQVAFAMTVRHSVLAIRLCSPHSSPDVRNEPVGTLGDVGQGLLVSDSPPPILQAIQQLSEMANVYSAATDAYFSLCDSYASLKR